MNTRKSFILALALFSLGLSFGEKIPANWYSFTMGTNMDPASPANIGNLILDSPAGKHGFCQVKDGHFYFEDGTQARFWGTNLVFEANFPSKNEAESIAKRLAFFGFNAVRLHHMDYYFDPQGIFEDTAPAYKNPQMKNTGTLSKRQLERLDYLIFQLKEQGIYIDMNLLVARHFTEADGVKFANELDIAGKPASLFDPQLINLQKQFAKDLLGHYNPYTKLHYYEDPAIALVEITNENTLFAKKSVQSLPEYYKDMLDELFKQWQKTSNSQSLEDFYTILEQNYFRTMRDYLRDECKIRVPITGSGIYSDQENLISQQDMDYIDAHHYWDHPSFPNEWSRENFRIKQRSMLEDRDLGIIGFVRRHNPNLIFKKPYTISEWNQAYPNPLGYETPVIIAAIARDEGWDGLFQFAYKHHLPLYNDSGIDTFFDIIQNPQQLLLVSLASRVFFSPTPSDIHLKDGAYQINTPYVQGMAGNIENRRCQLNDVLFKSQGNGAIYIYSPTEKRIQEASQLLLIAVADVKNKNSFWKDEKFNWGKAPILTKRVESEIQIKTTKIMKIFELTPEGKRGKEIKTIWKDNTLSFTTSNSDCPWFEITTDTTKN